MSNVKSVRPWKLAGVGAVLLWIALWLALVAPAFAKLGDFQVSLEPPEPPPFDPGDSQNVITDGPCGLSGRQLAVMFPKDCLIGLSFQGKDIEQGGMMVKMMVNKEGKRIVSVRFVFDAGPPGPKTDRYDTDEIPVESVDVDPSVGGTIVINKTGVQVFRFEKGQGRKPTKVPTDEKVNIGTAIYTKP